MCAGLHSLACSAFCQSRAFFLATLGAHFQGCFVPIFDDVKHSEDGSESGRFIRDWLNNTYQDA